MINRYGMRFFILLGLCLLCIIPIASQDENTADSVEVWWQADLKADYDEALRRIEAARVNGAKDLELNGLWLEYVPSEIGGLTNLQRLELTANRLINLSAVGQLTNLQELYLEGAGLTSLPAEIGQLVKLRTLHLNHNLLTSLPPEIGQLKNLQTLTITDNQLASLPPEIGQLTNLHKLNLTSNQLTSLPPEIGHLVNLQSLSLGMNLLTSLPPEIGQLTNLHKLNLTSNYVRSLPLEIGQLSQLDEFPSDTMLIFPPLKVQQQGAQAVVGYLRDYQAMMLRQTIAAVAAGVGGITLIILAFRWRQWRALSEKKKRL